MLSKPLAKRHERSEIDFWLPLIQGGNSFEDGDQGVKDDAKRV